MQYARRLKHLILCLVGILFVAFAPQAWGTEERSARGTGDPNLSETKGTDKDISTAEGHRVIVYYFHGNNRCHTCRRIEQLTQQAVTESFAHEIEAGRVEMKVINVDEEVNRHFTEDYQLYTRSVVISDVVKGKERQWKNLQRVWELVRSDETFKKYIRDEIRAYLS
ncbi:MAG: nitrophenyl compound nitroreductase subunit ArsF family protein [Thermodesulfobacteriota bacterium]|nr:nitrophenyl compound nitroreductase subunit ArsF family protein [Thermodesulfobacteriota bacterium]